MERVLDENSGPADGDLELIHQIDGIVWEANATTFAFTFVSKQAERILGYPISQWISDSNFWSSHIHPEDHSRAVAFCIEQTREGRSHSFEYRMTAADARVVWLRDHVTVVMRDGHPALLRGIMVDITDLKEAEHARQSLESQLRRSQKMEALGTLAGGIAHDFNNILAIISGNAEVALEREAHGDGKTVRALAHIVEASNRARDLVRQILTFSSREAKSRARIPFDETISDALTLLRATISAAFEIEVDLGCADAMIEGDTTQLHRIVMNLVTNSCQAMPGHAGRITISTARAAGDQLRLIVSDNGQGIDPAIVERIFDPFFTTKGAGNGTGLGLAVVHGIVEAHHGTIQVKSTQGVGTSFELSFPVAQQVASAAPAESTTRDQGHGQSILVIDDEEALAEVTGQMLEALGYTVTIANRPDTALEIVRQSEKPFSLILSDYSMPKMSGLQLAAEFQKLAQPVPILLMSGLNDSLNTQSAEQLQIVGFLQKPFLWDTLAKAVRGALEAAGQV